MAKKVEVISSSFVGATATTTSISRLDLHPWDLRALRLVPIQRGLMFHKPQIQSPIQHLKASLSRTLDFFPPLAGRLATTPHATDTASFFINCNNAGAEFTHAVAADVSVSDIIEPSYIPEIVSSSFFPIHVGASNLEGISKPLVGVQVTELADGLFIACAANHAVVDGTSFWHFLRSWSEISRGFESISKSPVFDRCSDIRLVHLPTLEENLAAPSQLPQKVFRFSREILDRLKAKANSEAGSDGKISTLQALLAHLWRSTARAQTITDSISTNRIMIISIGARARTSSLPDGYFGNAFYSAALAISEAELLQKGLGEAALRINELISEQSDEAIARDAEKEVEFKRMEMGVGSGPPLIIGSSHRHDVYGCDFGWGKPVAVRSGKAQKFEGLVVVLPAAEGGGGIDLEVCLKEETLRAMECDAEFVNPHHRHHHHHLEISH